MEKCNSYNKPINALAQLFYYISSSEKKIEAIRQRVSKSASFDILQTFNYFDQTNNNSISPQDLLSFLK